MYPYKRTILKCSHIDPNKSPPCEICQLNLRCLVPDGVSGDSIKLPRNAVGAIGPLDNKTTVFSSLRTPLNQTYRSVNVCTQPIHSELHVKTPQYKCLYCPKLFKRSTEFRRHTRTHTGEKPFICTVCNKCFSRKYNLKAHTQSVHMKLKRFECDMCKKQFLRKDKMQRHRKTVHKLNEMSCTLNEKNILQKENFRKSIQHHKRNMLSEKNYKQKVSTIRAQVNISSTTHSRYSNQAFSKIVNQNAHLDRSTTGHNLYNSGYVHDDCRSSGTSQITSSANIKSQNQAHHFPSTSSYVAELPNPCPTRKWDQWREYVSNPSNYLNDKSVFSQPHLFSKSANDVRIANPFSDSDNEYQTSVLESNGGYFYSAPPTPVPKSYTFTSMSKLHESVDPNNSVHHHLSSSTQNDVLNLTIPESEISLQAFGSLDGNASYKHQQPAKHSPEEEYINFLNNAKHFQDY